MEGSKGFEGVETRELKRGSGEARKSSRVEGGDANEQRDRSYRASERASERERERERKQRTVSSAAVAVAASADIVLRMWQCEQAVETYEA